MVIRKITKHFVYNLITQILGDGENYVEVPVLFGPARGLKFKLDLVNRKEGAYFVGYYDKNILEIISKIIKPGWIIWDCGTYLGFYTVFFSKLVGTEGFVVGIEPDISNLNRTLHNLRINRINNFKLLNFAISGVNNKRKFILSYNTNSHIQGTYVGGNQNEYSEIEEYDKEIEVETRNLNYLIKINDVPAPNLIKLDIEGAELEVFKNDIDFINDLKPLLIVELHNPECDEALWEFSVKHNYALYSLQNKYFASNKSEVYGTFLCMHHSDKKLQNYLSELKN